MKNFFLTLGLSVWFVPMLAQHSSRQEILAPVHQVFRAMAAGDSALLSGSFHPDVRLITVTIDSAGRTRVHPESSLQPFRNAVARAGAGVFYEPIHHIRIRNSGAYAEVWARYDFYLRRQFHHCGIDSFQLVQTSDGWKIIQLTDTRETTGCRPSEKWKPKS